MIYVLAYTEIQARLFVNNNKIPRNEYRYVVNADQLRGISNCTIILLNGWVKKYSPRKYAEICEMLDYLEHTHNVKVIRWMIEKYLTT